MFELKTLLEEVEDKDSKSNLINYITSNFYKTVNDKDGDPRKLLLLIAAISMLNLNDESAMAAARKLAQMSLKRK